MQTLSSVTIERFKRFKLEIFRELGQRVTLAYDGAVIVHAGPFSSECRFHSLQSALDNYARFLPYDLVNGKG